MKQFKIRASACGQIMTTGKGGLSKTTQTYCNIWLKEQLYGKHQKFSSKYTDKGLIVEDDSIDFAAEYLNLGFILKNKKYFENDFFTGTPDVITKDLIIDVKNSWDCFTFPLFDDKINKDYFYQAQVYMELCNIDNYKLIYTLMDTPQHLIEKEAYWYAKNNGDVLDDELLNKFTNQMTYNNIDKDLRIKVYDIKRDKDVIKSIEQRVIECRDYINSLL